MSNDSQTTAPVTYELLKELTNTEDMVALYENPRTRLNDKDHYCDAVLQLEALALAVLEARTNGSLLRPQVETARFRVDARSQVTSYLDDVTSYLRNEAVDLLRDNGSVLDRYNKTNTEYVRGRLAGFIGVILADVRHTANMDLNQISYQGARRLVSVARIVAQVAADENVQPAGVIKASNDGS